MATGFVLCAGVIAVQGLPVAARVWVERQTAVLLVGRGLRQVCSTICMQSVLRIRGRLCSVCLEHHHRCQVCVQTARARQWRQCVCWWEVLHSLLLHRAPHSLFSASRQEVW